MPRADDFVVFRQKHLTINRLPFDFNLGILEQVSPTHLLRWQASPAREAHRDVRASAAHARGATAALTSPRVRTKRECRLDSESTDSRLPRGRAVRGDPGALQVVNDTAVGQRAAASDLSD